MTIRREKICNTPECRRMRALLSDFLDHTLHWRTSRSLEVHLAACPPCRCYVATIERTIMFYRERPVVDVPVAVRVHLREVLRERCERAPKERAVRPRAAVGKRAGAGIAARSSKAKKKPANKS